MLETLVAVWCAGAGLAAVLLLFFLAGCCVLGAVQSGNLRLLLSADPVVLLNFTVVGLLRCIKPRLGRFPTAASTTSSGPAATPAPRAGRVIMPPQ